MGNHGLIMGNHREFWGIMGNYGFSWGIMGIYVMVFADASVLLLPFVLIPTNFHAVLYVRSFVCTYKQHSPII